MDRVNSRGGRFFIHAVLVAFAIYSLTPFLWTTLQSFKTFKDAFSRVPIFIFQPTWANYQDVWIRSLPDAGSAVGYFILLAAVILTCLMLFARHIPLNSTWIYIAGLVGYGLLLWAIPQMVYMQKYYNYFINTIIVTVFTILISISIGCLAGYSLARYAGMAAVVILIAALAFRALPRLAFVLPYYWIGSLTNLLDTHILVIIALVAVNQPFTIWMLRSFFMEVPKDLEESAMVDGANRLTSFLHVIVPVAWPGIISTALFTLLLAYNEFLLVRVLTQTNWTLPVAISRYTGAEDPAQLTLAAAASVSATIPIIVVILFFQKHLVRGLAAGAVKG
ncbi:MAG: carbohydrate ABC transporter permease [Chloroflexi bacterium]|nr:carbohydrate ABC transporter permease [Chloroflexota bacterium]